MKNFTFFTLRGLCFGEDLERKVEKGCMIKKMQGSVDFGYQLAICPSLRK